MKISKKKIQPTIQTNQWENSEYVVGYGRPPLHARFKKGQSGNPSGRPRGKNNDFSRIFAKELNLKVSLSGGGSITKQIAIIRQLINRAAKGDSRSLKIVMGMQQKIERKDKAERFLEKLFKDNYLTEESVDNYLYRNKVLESELPCPRIGCSINLGAMCQTLLAQISLVYAIMLSEILLFSEALISVFSKHEKIIQEHIYWQGAKDCISTLNLSSPEKEKVLSKLEKIHPAVCSSRAQYELSQRMVKVSTWVLRKKFSVLFDFLKKQPGYYEEEQEFEKKGRHCIFLEKESDLSEEEFKKEKKHLEMLGLAYDASKELPTVRECQKHILKHMEEK